MKLVSKTSKHPIDNATSAEDLASLTPALKTIGALRTAALDCKACDLWKTGTQTVFGEGPSRSQIMFVGEQPGDQEDRAGHPFVGPAGKLLDRALEQAGIDRTRRAETLRLEEWGRLYQAIGAQPAAQRKQPSPSRTQRAPAP